MFLTVNRARPRARSRARFQIAVYPTRVIKGEDFNRDCEPLGEKRLFENEDDDKDE